MHTLYNIFEQIFVTLIVVISKKSYWAMKYHKLKLSTIGDDNLLWSFSILWSKGLDFLDDIHAFHYASKNNVLSIKPFCFCCAQKELRSICVRSCIGHWENSWSSVLQIEVFIRKLGSVNWLSTSSIVGCEVSALAHEIWDYSVKWGSFEAESFFSGTKASEIFGCFWYNVTS